MSSNTDNENQKEKKFGIPNWMVHNMERLNVSTDFEEYAQSPPASEGFLTDYPLDSPGACNHPPKFQDEDQHKFDLGLNSESDFLSKNIGQSNIKIPQAKFDSLHKTLLDVLKCDDIVYSSPDSTPYSTPFSTPQPSPAPQRKTSLTTPQTVQSNPEKWFYVGGKDKNKIKLLTASELKQTNTRVQSKKVEMKHVKPKMSVKDHSVKLAISNFDLNAISPSSW